VIRRHRPDIVVTGNFRETYGGVMLNQADHIAVGRAVVDAVRDAGNRWVFRDLIDEGHEPWNGVRAVWAGGSPDARHAGRHHPPTSPRASRRSKHTAAYIAGLNPGQMPDAGEFLEGMAREAGSRLGTRFAASFEVFPM